MKSLNLFFIILLQGQCQRNQTYVSNHLQKHLSEYLEKNGQNRLLMNYSQPYWPLRLEYKFIDKSDTSKLQHVVDLLEIAKSFFGSHFLVQGNNQKIQFKNTGQNYCFEYQIQDEIASEDYEADIMFFVTMENGDFLASAGPCAFDLIQARPIFGLIGFGNQIPLDQNLVDDIQYEKNIETTIHEIFHGLGFISGLFNQYFDSASGKYYANATQTLNGILYIQTPRLLQYTQFHFGCPSATGLPMEDQGGQGTQDSHWERRLFNNELMTGSDMTGDFLLTIFTFKLLEDSGPDPFKFGAFKGCDFFNFGCKKNVYPEFCYDLQGKAKCSFDRTGYGSCQTDFLADNCQMISVFQDFDCRDEKNFHDAKLIQQQIMENNLIIFDYDSICLDGSLTINRAEYNIYNRSAYTHSCHRFQCSQNKKEITLFVGSEQFICTNDSQQFSSNLYDGSIFCPHNIWLQCYGFAECPDQCNMKGFCMNKICHCMVGYSGNACQQNCSNYRYNQGCVLKCPNQTFADKFTMNCLGCPYGCDKCSAVGLCTRCLLGYDLSVGFCERNFSIQLQVDIAFKSSILTMMRTDDQISTQGLLLRYLCLIILNFVV